MAPEDKRWVVGMFDGFDKSSLTYGKPLVDTVLDIATLQKSFSLASREVHPALRNDRADTGIQIPKSKQIAWENIKAAMKECKIEGEGPEKLERKRSGSILRSWSVNRSH